MDVPSRSLEKLVLTPKRPTLSMAKNKKSLEVRNNKALLSQRSPDPKRLVYDRGPAGPCQIQLVTKCE